MRADVVREKKAPGTVAVALRGRSTHNQTNARSRYTDLRVVPRRLQRSDEPELLLEMPESDLLSVDSILMQTAQQKLKS